MAVIQPQYCGSPTTRLARLEELVGTLGQTILETSPQLIYQLHDCLTNLPSNLTADERLQAWRLSYSIWNFCVSVANTLQTGQSLDEDHAKLRQIASDLLFMAGNVDEIDSGLFKISAFFYRTGVIWHSLQRYEQAAVCFEKVTELMSKAHEEHERNATPRSKEERDFMFDLFVARSRTAWELSQKALASSLSARARGLLPALPERSAQLAHHYFEFGESLLDKQDTESQTDAIKYLEQAFEIISSTPALDSASSSQKELAASKSSPIPGLKIKILRHLAAGHLQRENYDSALKCIAVLKSAPNHHPGNSYIALKALAGLGRYEEAGQELIALVQDNAANAQACISGIEIITQDPNRLDSAKYAFLLLHSRYPSDKSLPVRILECLLRRRLPDMEAVTKVKALDVVLEIASNDGIVTTVTSIDHGGSSMLENVISVSKEQKCIHVLLWNSGSEHFQAKQYETCIKLFETSMLYLPHDSDSNLQRAKSFRVLCLCRLALMQYDRALEYVTEAEKIHPNIASAFLKFKIHLQTKNEAAAAEQVAKMTICPDFESEYLTLASHEAMTCNSTKIAISALSAYLNLSEEQRTTGTKDVVVIRNIVSLALQNEQSSQPVVIKYLKEAQSRLTECGFDAFFGLGNVGQQEANWFAITSWNQGLAAVKKTLGWQLAGDYFSCAADFFASLPDTKENLRYLHQSLLLAASSLLASTTGAEYLRSVSRMLEKCRKVQRALAMSMDTTEATNDNSEIHLSLLLFEMKNRTKDFKSQIDLLHHCASLPGFEVHFFIHMAQQASKAQTEGVSNEVISIAYRLGLKSILNSPSPDYNLVALIVRQLISLADQHCKDGPEVMTVYKQAKEILAGLDPGEYPHEELEWLVATSWNRAGLQVTFSRISVAEAWMEMAIDLANYDPLMENRKLSMIDNLKKVQQNKRSSIADGDL